MLMQCATTSGLGRPRNLSESSRPPGPPAFCKKGGGVLDGGGWRGRRRGGGNAAGCLWRDAGGGALSPGGSGRERGRAGQWEGQSPSLGAARRAHGIINRGSVSPHARPNTHTFTPSLGPSFPLFCLLVTRCLLNNCAAAFHWRWWGEKLGGLKTVSRLEGALCDSLRKVTALGVSPDPSVAERGEYKGVSVPKSCPKILAVLKLEPA